MSLSFSIFGFSFEPSEWWIDVLRIQSDTHSFTVFSVFKTNDWYGDDTNFWEITFLGISYNSKKGWV